MAERSEVSPPTRERQLERLRAEKFDVCVIGGGINGAAIARDAAMRGLDVALIDKGDFAGATSSRSSKLIHGGLRYLPQGQLRLVHNALRERERLRRVTAPHLVRPIRFLFPFYRGRRPGRFGISVGLVLYDLFARTPRAERHRGLSVENARSVEPSLRTEGMAGAALYYDAYADDARVTLENVLDATFHGAVALNYVELSSFSRIDGKLGAASVIDGEGKSGFEIRARSFINAAGPWSDDIRRMDDPGCRPAVRLTKGVHLIVPAVHLSIRVPLVLTDQGGRIVFAIPFGRFVIVGTTDTDFEGDRELVGADASDETYLLEVVAGAIRGFNPSRDKVAYRFAGLRALELSLGQRPSAVARDEVIVESPSGLITVAGGKLTTHREVAERIVDRLVRTLGKGSRRCPTGETPMPGARPFDAGIDARDVLDPEVWQALERRYGTRAGAVARILRENSELARPLALDPLVIAAEAVHAVRNEFARTITDFIERRTGLVWRAPDIALKAAGSAIPVMAAELNWNRARQEAEAAAFEANFNRSSRTKPEEHP